MHQPATIHGVPDDECYSFGNSTCTSPDSPCSRPPSPNPNGAPPSHPPRHRYAEPPFNRVDADVILTSSDNIDFFLHTAVFELASPALKQVALRNLQINSVAEVKRYHGQELPVYQVSEDSATLDYILRHLYPTEAPKMDDLDFDFAANVFAAAQKYEIGFIKEAMFNWLLGKFYTNGLNMMGTFALSCQKGIEPVAREIAKEIRCNIADFRGISEFLDFEWMDDITAGQYYRLICYLENSSLSNTLSPPPPTFIHERRHAPFIFPEALLPKLPASDLYNDSQHDIVVESREGVSHRAHRVVLTKASPKFKHLERVFPYAHIPSTKVHEEDNTTKALLALCYSSFELKIDDLEFLHNLMQIARKYEITNAIERMRGVFLTLAEKRRGPIDLVRSFCRAVMYGWDQETGIIANWIIEAEDLIHIQGIPLPVIPEMDEIPARKFAKLLRHLYLKGLGRPDPRRQGPSSHAVVPTRRSAGSVEDSEIPRK
ncbi:hypothetical protein NLI96_g7884 [Meripilus lineatus]|uniref:BTB domain-containing protein n=1 Tax=Meripilus lineatus TaxID=2056292 RepID=A0AAD5V3H8_9APHY|nr:hypothetical protein NLI96_g7884 [Physisporinus lineatus]